MWSCACASHYHILDYNVKHVNPRATYTTNATQQWYMLLRKPAYSTIHVAFVWHFSLSVGRNTHHSPHTETLRQPTIFRLSKAAGSIFPLAVCVRQNRHLTLSSSEPFSKEISAKKCREGAGGTAKWKNRAEKSLKPISLIGKSTLKLAEKSFFAQTILWATTFLSSVFHPISSLESFFPSSSISF